MFTLKKLDEFRDRIAGCETEKEIETACADQLKYYDEVYTLKSKRSAIRDCRYMLREIKPDHPALKFMVMPADESQAYRENYQEIVYNKSARQTELDPEYHAGITRDLLDSYLDGSVRSYLPAAIALGSATGRRIFSEILSVGKFEVLAEDRLLFSGQAKTKEG